MRKCLLPFLMIFIVLCIFTSCNDDTIDTISTTAVKIPLPDDFTEDDLNALQQIRIKNNGKDFKTIYAEDISSAIKSESARSVSSYYFELDLPNGNHNLSVETSSLQGHKGFSLEYGVDIHDRKIIIDPIEVKSINKPRLYLQSDVALCNPLNIKVVFKSADDPQPHTFRLNLGSEVFLSDYLKENVEYSVTAEIVLDDYEKPYDEKKKFSEDYEDILNSYSISKSVPATYIYDSDNAEDIEIGITNEKMKEEGCKLIFTFSSGGYFKYLSYFNIGAGLSTVKEDTNWTRFTVPYLGFEGNKPEQEVYFPQGYIQTLTHNEKSFSAIQESVGFRADGYKNQMDISSINGKRVEIYTSSEDGKTAWINLIIPPLSEDITSQFKYLYREGNGYKNFNDYSNKNNWKIAVKPGKQNVEVLFYEDFKKLSALNLKLVPEAGNISVKDHEVLDVKLKLVERE